MPTKKAASRAGTSDSNLEGKKAPPFALPDASGAAVRLKDLIGRGNLVLYFYPKDMTPGCTREACGFQERFSEIAATGAQVAGISGDSSDSHRKFAEKYGLKFPLLSDSNHGVAKAYGVYKKKSPYGREFMGIERSTFLIDKSGTIRKVFPKVKVDGHAEAVIGALKEIG